MSVAQVTDFNIDPNTTNGTQLADILNRLHDAGLTAHSGAARPAYAQPGTIWLDSSATPILKWFDGANDVQLASVSSSIALPVGNPVNSTDALNLQTGDSRYVNVAGDTMTGGLIADIFTAIGAGSGQAVQLTVNPATNYCGLAHEAPQGTFDAWGLYFDCDPVTKKMIGANFDKPVSVKNKLAIAAIATAPLSSYALELHTSWLAPNPTVQVGAVYAPGAGLTACHINVGSAAGPTYQRFELQSNGIGFAPGGWQQGSDRRLKTDIKLIANALSKLQNVSGYTFKRTDLGDRPMGGVIAQEIQAVLPEGVSEMGGEDNYLAVDPMPLIGLLVEAVKELEARVKALGG